MPEDRVAIPKTGVAPTTVMEWLNQCETNHEICGSVKTTLDEGKDVFKIFLIDVVAKCLVQTTYQDRRYVTLSYVWGRTNQFKCSRANLDTLKGTQGLMKFYNKIPQTIRDGIDFVASIGESYIWVDSLCIIQDDAIHKEEQISGMATIYGNSLFTIVAASGQDANSGLSGVAGQPRRIDMRPLPSRPGLFIIPKPSLLDDFYQTLYNDRAWTFQERLLSRRCIYLLNNQAYFQCRVGILSEDCDDSFGTELPNLKPPLDIPSPSVTELSILNPLLVGRSLGTEAIYFAQYLKLAYEYLSKELSNPSDIVHAFSGILEYFGNQQGWTFVHCLPVQFLDAAL
ncbi:hypothetical protein NW759_017495, partial [Fusarium solani]